MTSLRVELSEQVTTRTILICNSNNETIKICSRCKQQYSVYRLENTAIIYDEQALLSFLYVNTLALYTKNLQFKRNAHSNVMYYIFIRYLYVFQIHVLYFSCPAISCPAFSVNPAKYISPVAVLAVPPAESMKADWQIQKFISIA